MRRMAEEAQDGTLGKSERWSIIQFQYIQEPLRPEFSHLLLSASALCSRFYVQPKPLQCYYYDDKFQKAVCCVQQPRQDFELKITNGL